MSQAIVESKNLFAKFDKDRDGFISEHEFNVGMDEFFQPNEATSLFKQRVQELQEYIESNRVDYITWSKLLAPQDIPSIIKGCKLRGPLSMAAPTEEEVLLIEKMYVDTTSTAAQTCGRWG